MKPKHQRLVLALVAITALIGATLIAISALSDEASYFYTPTTLKEKKIEPNQALRLGGMVKKKSIKRESDGISISFIVQDKGAQQLVRYTGVTPSLFVEGSGVVADGRMNQDGIFIADNLLAKHDENYVPRELMDVDLDSVQSIEKSVVK